MSAIAGIQHLNTQLIDPTHLQRMTEILAHRGPDGSNIWYEGSVGLGHRMLWSTPESLLETLPWINSSRQVITADVRLDNREELIAALDLHHCPAEKITDSHIILSAYEKWQEQCAEKLLGDFAFAIWDSSQQCLFCARDHFGVKPFFYHASDERFIFASEIKAILSVPGVPRCLNEVRVGDFLTSLFDDTSITFYQEILRLPPAHTLMVSASGIKLQRYWALDPAREIRFETDQEYADAFRTIFTEAVRCRLRSAFPVGSFLSGGLDSSSIACAAEKLLAQKGVGPLPTFSAVFDQVPECDERSFQNAVLNQGNFEPHYFHADQSGPLDKIEQMLWHQDEPFFAGNLFLTSGLYKIAQQRGVRVTLDGFDGDSTVSHGVGHYRELALAGRWLALLNETWGMARNFNLSVWSILFPYIQNFSPVGRIGKRAWRSLRHRIQPHRHPDPEPLPWANDLDLKFAQQIELEQRYRKMAEFSPPYRTEREKHHQILTWGLVPYALEMIDRAAAAAAIEPRFPFWDKRLVEFCLALPPQQKLHHGWSRWVMRQAMSDILPKEVQWRTDKTNMGTGFRYGLLNFNPLLLEKTVMDDAVSIEQYVNPSALQATYHQFMSAGQDADAVKLWTKTILTLWLRQLNPPIPTRGGDV